MTDREIRAWYKSQVSKIAALDRDWARRGDNVEERARQAWHIRTDVRLRARAMMTDRVKIEELRIRDTGPYGSPDGPSLSHLVAKYTLQGLHGDQLLERILRAAKTTNPNVRP